MSEANGSPPQAAMERLQQALGKLGKANTARLKLRELHQLEEQLGRSILGEIGTPAPAMDLMQGMLWLLLHRVDAEVSFDEVGELSFDELMEALGTDQEPDPTPAASSKRRGASTSRTSPRSAASTPPTASSTSPS
jgi:hypothetical protein